MLVACPPLLRYSSTQNSACIPAQNLPSLQRRPVPISPFSHSILKLVKGEVKWHLHAILQISAPAVAGSGKGQIQSAKNKAVASYQILVDALQACMLGHTLSEVSLQNLHPMH